MKSKLFFFILVLGSISCGEYEVLEVTKNCNRIADSLFLSHKDSLIKEFDKVCVENSEEYYKIALDSLTKSRISDIKNLIEK